MRTPTLSRRDWFRVSAGLGLSMSGWLPGLAAVRSMSTKEGDHGRATYYLRTGNLPQGAIQFPTLGSLVSKEIGDPSAELPNFVSVAPFRFFSQGAFGPGFLGPNHAPLIVGQGDFGPPQPGDGADRSLRVQA